MAEQIDKLRVQHAKKWMDEQTDKQSDEQTNKRTNKRAKGQNNIPKNYNWM